MIIGKYLLQCSVVGYEKYFSNVIDLTQGFSGDKFQIQLQELTKGIKEIKVLSKKPMIEVKADKTVFNVEQSINAAGTNALDLLRKSPGVRVDKDENIELQGSDWDLNFREQSGPDGDSVTTVSISIYNESLDRLEKMIEMGFKEGFTMTLNYLEELLTKLSGAKESK